MDDAIGLVRNSRRIKPSGSQRNTRLQIVLVLLNFEYAIHSRKKNKFSSIVFPSFFP